MVTKKNKLAFARGVSFIEILISIVILGAGVIGASGYRYYATVDARKADVKASASRLAWMLLSNWKGAGGYSGYTVYEAEDSDPEDMGDVELPTGLETYYNEPGPDVPAGFTALDAIGQPNYRIVLDAVNYYATLSYKDVSNEPRELNVSVAWMENFGTWDDAKSYDSVNLSTYADD